jgi:hemoglobin-like flavoprotein
MHPDTIRLVRDSWTRIGAIAPEAAALFYRNLFAVAPNLQPLFKGDMAAQGASLMRMLGAAVERLDHIDTLVPMIQDLGRRHATYGVRVADYESVRVALLRTLEQGLGSDFTPATKVAWARVFGIVSSTMIAAATD